MSEADQDKTEEASSYRLEEARKRGEVAKSPDAVGLAVMATFAVVMGLTAAWALGAMAHATRATLSIAGGTPTPGPALFGWMQQTWAPVWRALTPLALALVAVAVIANVAQTGPVFSTQPITPDFKRLNPMQTVKRLFSMKTLWELGKLLIKIGLLAALAWFFWGDLHALVESVAATPPARLPALALRAFTKVSIYVLGILALLAFLDLLMTRREFLRKMRTSRRELKDEIKKRDGDPEVKGKQKQLIRELLKKARSVPKAAEADVILTNPTHYAVALKYSPGSMRAPVILTKGAGFLSQRIREVGSRHGVPIVRSPALTRALYREGEIDRPVPELLYAQIAPIYRWLMSRKARQVAA
jgi:flagellar biosynthetic protein FlhB